MLFHALCREEQTKLCVRSMYSDVAVFYMKQVGTTGENMGPHALQATIATSALGHRVDIVKVQEWLRRASISTTSAYDPRGSKLESSPSRLLKYLLC